MSYCVNCGVELDKTCSSCPLCNTPVLNPNQPIDTEGVKPFPVTKGTSEPDKNKEFTIFLSVILATTGLVCFILNQFIFDKSNWSIYVIGICVMLWTFFLPVFFPNAVNSCFSLILNGLIIAVYLRVISFLHPGNGWYEDIALPIVSLATILLLIYYFYSYKKKRSFLSKTIMLIGNLACISAAIEILTDLHYKMPISLSWSFIVLACCISIDVILIALYFLTGIRAEIRRRMHF